MINSDVQYLDLECYPIFYGMSKRGIAVNLDKLGALLDEVVAKKDEQKVLVDYYAEEELDPMSGDQVSKWMVKQGFTGKKTKKTQRLATDEKSLKMHDHPALDAVVEYRGLEKLKGTFIEPTIVMANRNLMPNNYCGIIHPRWRLTRVRSGRVAMEDPNLLAFPVRDEMGKKVRDCFVARPGYRMMSIDYSQLEPRIVAGLSQSPTLLRVYREERDLYTEVAATMGGIPRQVAKTLTLGILYGMSGRRLADELLAMGMVKPDGSPMFDPEDCEGLITRWFDAFPEVRRLVEYVCAEARRDNGWATTTLGRGRFLPGLFLSGRGWPEEKLRQEAERQAFNHRIQGTGMEELKRAMVRVSKVAEFHLLLAIHDELIGEVLERDLDRVPQQIVDLMASVFHEVPLKVSWKLGNTWGELK